MACDRYCFDPAGDWVACSPRNSLAFGAVQTYLGNMTEGSTILVRQTIALQPDHAAS